MISVRIILLERAISDQNRVFALVIGRYKRLWLACEIKRSFSLWYWRE